MRADKGELVCMKGTRSDLSNEIITNKVFRTIIKELNRQANFH